MRVTSVVVFGEDGTAQWTVMARQGSNLLAVASADTEEDAIFVVLGELGVLSS